MIAAVDTRSCFVRTVAVRARYLSQVARESPPGDVLAACWESPARVGSARSAAVFPAQRIGRTTGSQSSADYGSGRRLRECSPSDRGTLPKTARSSPPESAWTVLWPTVSRQTGTGDETYLGKRLRYGGWLYVER